MFMTNEFIREKTNVSTFRGRSCLSAKGNAFVLKDMKTKEILYSIPFIRFITECYKCDLSIYMGINCIISSGNDKVLPLSNEQILVDESAYEKIENIAESNCLLF